MIVPEYQGTPEEVSAQKCKTAFAEVKFSSPNFESWIFSEFKKFCFQKFIKLTHDSLKNQFW